MSYDAACHDDKQDHYDEGARSTALLSSSTQRDDDDNFAKFRFHPLSGLCRSGTRTENDGFRKGLE